MRFNNFFFFSLFHFFCNQSNMARSSLSVHGGNHGDEEPPVTRAELRHMENSLLEAMERMFNERLPAVGGRGPRRQHKDNHYEEFDDENSGFGDRFHGRFGDDHGGHGGGRCADFNDQRGGGRRVHFVDHRGGGRGHDRHVHFDDEDAVHNDYDENPFAHYGRFGQPHEHRRAAGHDGNIIIVIAIKMIQMALLV